MRVCSPELQVLLNQDSEANAFFESRPKSYKQRYCDWIGWAKQQETRQVRAGKAMVMLRNKQKTLKAYTQFIEVTQGCLTLSIVRFRCFKKIISFNG